MGLEFYSQPKFVSVVVGEKVCFVWLCQPMLLAYVTTDPAPVLSELSALVTLVTGWTGFVSLYGGAPPRGGINTFSASAELILRILSCLSRPVVGDSHLTYIHRRRLLGRVCDDGGN